MYTQMLMIATKLTPTTNNRERESPHHSVDLSILGGVFLLGGIVCSQSEMWINSDDDGSGSAFNRKCSLMLAAGQPHSCYASCRTFRRIIAAALRETQALGFIATNARISQVLLSFLLYSPRPFGV